MICLSTADVAYGLQVLPTQRDCDDDLDGVPSRALHVERQAAWAIVPIAAPSVNFQRIPDAFRSPLAPDPPSMSPPLSSNRVMQA